MCVSFEKNNTFFMTILHGKINNSIPVRCVRFITHPFIERKKPNMTKRQSSAASATDDEYEDVNFDKRTKPF